MRAKIGLCHSLMPDHLVGNDTPPKLDRDVARAMEAAKQDAITRFAHERRMTVEDLVSAGWTFKFGEPTLRRSGVAWVMQCDGEAVPPKGVEAA